MEILLIGIVIIIWLVMTSKAPTVGFRNRNPFNIRLNYIYKNSFLTSEGEKGFLKFVELNDGIVAGYRLLFYYFEKLKSKTYPVTSFIKKYAEGDEGYIKFLKSKFGENIPFEKIYELGKEIVYFENGGWWILKEEDFKKAYEIAKKAQGYE